MSPPLSQPPPRAGRVSAQPMEGAGRRGEQPIKSFYIGRKVPASEALGRWLQVLFFPPVSVKFVNSYVNCGL